MNQTTSNRNLLFGVIALEMNFITRDALIAALQCCAHENDKPLSLVLRAQGVLADDECSLLDSLVKMHVKRHGDAERSLSAFDSAGRLSRDFRDAAGGEPSDIPRRLPDTPAVGVAVVADQVRAGARSTVGGRFRVLRSHARGGQGEVFIARDAELNREVALKQIQPRYADHPESRARFLLEAEVTGRLEHPGVIPVYGLGYFDDGRPFYAMRLIRGDSLKDAIDRFHQRETPGRDPGERSLSLRALLRRFVDVCNALEYAHSRGVLHRDLKPGNVMLGPYGETLVVDWGLAKTSGAGNGVSSTDERPLWPRSPSPSTPTLMGEVIGTPAYMSPEQARGELDRLSTRSDVYGLGATLYTLLTGRPPFESDDIGEILDRARSGEFVAPRALAPAIDPALELVCMKAMAPNADDRYATCRELADDVERWMADEAVTAGREPLVTWARRWARRNRTAVISIAASLLVALFGTAAVLVVQTKANGQLQQANVALKLSNTREKERFDLAIEAITLFSGEVGDDLVLKADQFKPLRDRLLRGALDFYTKLERMLRNQEDRASRAALGNAYFALGALTLKIGDKAEALGIEQKGLAIRRVLASESPADDEYQFDVANSLHSIALVLEQTGRSVEALGHFEEARDVLARLPGSGPGSAKGRELLGRVCVRIGWVLANAGKADAAMKAYDHAVETFTRLCDENASDARLQSRLASVYHNIGLLKNDVGDQVGAMVSYDRAVAIQQKVVDDNPGSAPFRSYLADIHNNIGLLKQRTGNPAEAWKSYQRALPIYEALARDNPAVTEIQRRLAYSHSNAAILLSDTGKPSEALGSLQRALAIQQKLAAGNPSSTEFQGSLARTYDNIGWILMQSGRPADAVIEFSREESICKKLVQDEPSVPDHKFVLANCQTNAATALIRLGKAGAAQALSTQAVALRGALVEKYPDTPLYRAGLGDSLLRSGLARRDAGDAAGASADWRRGDALLEAIATLEPEHVFVHGCCHAALSTTVPGGESDAEANRALAILRRAVALGLHDIGMFQTETALNALRGRADFQLLMMDLAFPSKPFGE